jgi:hypothetical protein
MRITSPETPRVFDASPDGSVRVADCTHIALEADEQVTFTTASGGEYDVTRKSWGFYATPSLNERLVRFGLRGVLVKNPAGRHYVNLVERGHEDDFQKYIDFHHVTIVAWLDTDAALAALTQTEK